MTLNFHNSSGTRPIHNSLKKITVMPQILFGGIKISSVEKSYLVEDSGVVTQVYHVPGVYVTGQVVDTVQVRAVVLGLHSQ